jgi:tRNA G10  N-methylase Trm11
MIEDLPPNYFNKVITDPPWGSYTKIDDIEEFYLAILQKFASLLINQGIIILVVGRQVVVGELIERLDKKLKILIKYDILLSGKKASIYKTQRIY